MWRSNGTNPNQFPETCRGLKLNFREVSTWSRLKGDINLICQHMNQDYLDVSVESWSSKGRDIKEYRIYKTDVISWNVWKLPNGRSTECFLQHDDWTSGNIGEMLFLLSLTDFTSWQRHAIELFKGWRLRKPTRLQISSEVTTLQSSGHVVCQDLMQG